jgi:hypothetical protein
MTGVLGASLPARAGDGRSAVVVVEGADSEAITAAVAAHVAAPHTVRDAHAFRASLAAHGFRTLAGAVANRGKDTQLIARAHAAAEDAKVDVAILVAIRKKGRKDRVLHVWVIDARRDGAVADEDVTVSHPGTDEQASAVWDLSSGLFPAPAPTPPPAPPEAEAKPAAPSPVAKDEGVAEKGPEEDKGAEPSAEPPDQPRGKTLLVVAAGGGSGSRHFTYTDRLTAQLRPYNLGAAPIVSGSAEVYPLANTKLPAFVRGFGITGGYGLAVGLSSSASDASQVGTSWQMFDVGARERLRVSRAVLVGVSAGYGGNDFHLSTSSSALAGAVLPSVEYGFVRAGLDARVAFGALSIFGGGDYLDVVSTGHLGTVFPHETVGGVAGDVGVAYVFAKHFEASLAVRYTRFFFSANPVPGDTNVAGGMLDEMTHTSLKLAYMP